jgi:hypothetical protein
MRIEKGILHSSYGSSKITGTSLDDTIDGGLDYYLILYALALGLSRQFR